MTQVEDICRRMEDLCLQGGLDRFDRVKFVSAPDEVWFFWEERKLAVVVELTMGPEAMAAVLAEAVAGDAVLN